MAIADEILEYRAKHNMTQGQLADKVGVTVQTISNIENGYQTPSRLTEKKLKLVIEKGE